MANRYFYVGNNPLAFNNIVKQQPILLTFCKNMNSKQDLNEWHMHSYLEIFYFEKGSGLFEFENKQYIVNENDYLIIDANHMHRQHPQKLEGSLVYYCLSVDNISLHGLPPNCLSHYGMTKLTFQNNNNLIYKNLIRMLNELIDQKYDYFSKVVAIFHELLVDTLRLNNPENLELAHNSVFSPASPYINAAKSYIDEHYTEEITLDDLAKIAYMNKNSFLKQFKKQVNVSPMHYLTLVRLEQAKLQLIKTDKSVTEISSYLQFSNSCYFSEMFKKNFGTSPTAFRKFMRENN